SWSATGSTGPSAIATCRSSASSREHEQASRDTREVDGRRVERPLRVVRARARVCERRAGRRRLSDVPDVARAQGRLRADVPDVRNDARQSGTRRRGARMAQRREAGRARLGRAARGWRARRGACRPAGGLAFGWRRTFSAKVLLLLADVTRDVLLL